MEGNQDLRNKEIEQKTSTYSLLSIHIFVILFISNSHIYPPSSGTNSAAHLSTTGTVLVQYSYSVLVLSTVIKYYSYYLLSLFVIFFDKKFAVLSPDIPAPIITVFKFKFNLILNNLWSNLILTRPNYHHH